MRTALIKLFANTRERRDDNFKSDIIVSGNVLRCGEERNELVQFEKWARPAVNEDNGDDSDCPCGIVRFRRFHVDKVNVESFDGRFEIVVFVD